jgi:hypothetical protein
MTDDTAVQATVVLHLLGRDRAYPRAEVFAAIPGVSTDELRAALASLADAGVIQLTETGIKASAALRRLDEIGLIVI